MSAVTLDEIRDYLNNRPGYEFAIPMLNAIETTEQFSPYGENFRRDLNDWLDNGGTVLLRDCICERFRMYDFVLEQTGPLDEGKHPYAFVDMWMTLDSARHELRFAKEKERKDMKNLEGLRQIPNFGMF